MGIRNKSEARSVPFLKLRRTGWGLLLALLGPISTSSVALARYPGSDQVPVDSSRIAKIWRAADNRALQITDVWFQDGEFPKCIQLLKFRADLYPKSYEIYTDLGWMQENVEHWAEALATYVKFKNLNAGHPDAPYPEAQFYFIKKLYAKVIPLLEPTIALLPHANTFRVLAQSYERLGLLEDAKRVWTKYLSASPDDAAAKNNLNRVLKKLKGETVAPPPSQK